MTTSESLRQRAAEMLSQTDAPLDSVAEALLEGANQSEAHALAIEGAHSVTHAAHRALRSRQLAARRLQRIEGDEQRISLRVETESGLKPLHLCSVSDLRFAAMKHRARASAELASADALERLVDLMMKRGVRLVSGLRREEIEMALFERAGGEDEHGLLHAA